MSRIPKKEARGLFMLTRQECRELDARIRKQEASRPTGKFFRWLKKQDDRDRGDPVGDVAYDAVRDKTYPRDENDIRKLLKYLKKSNACEGALEALAVAYREWVEDEIYFTLNEEEIREAEELKREEEEEEAERLKQEEEE